MGKSFLFLIILSFPIPILCQTSLQILMLPIKKGVAIESVTFQEINIILLLDLYLC